MPGGVNIGKRTFTFKITWVRISKGVGSINVVLEVWGGGLVKCSIKVGTLGVIILTVGMLRYMEKNL